MKVSLPIKPLSVNECWQGFVNKVGETINDSWRGFGYIYSMAQRLDFTTIIDTKRGQLTIIAEGKPHITTGGNKHRTVVCRCDCGKMITTQMSAVLSGATKSCGCLSRMGASKRATQRNFKHGGFSKPEYNVWCSMKKRCLNPKHKAYKDYGGRGITVCAAWVNSFEQFIKDMGRRPSALYSVERNDVNGNYEPNNCRWATKTEQSRNQRNNVMVTYNGETKCMGEWAEIVGISWQALHHRIFIAKWPLDEAFTRPLDHNNKIK